MLQGAMAKLLDRLLGRVQEKVPQRSLLICVALVALVLAYMLPIEDRTLIEETESPERQDVKTS